MEAISRGSHVLHLELLMLMTNSLTYLLIYSILREQCQLTVSLVTRVHAVIFPVTVPRLVDTFPRRHTAELIRRAQRRRPHDSRRRLRQLGAPVGVGRRAVLLVGVVVAIDVAVTAPDQWDTLLTAALPVVVIARHWL